MTSTEQVLLAVDVLNYRADLAPILALAAQKVPPAAPSVGSKAFRAPRAASTAPSLG